MGNGCYRYLAPDMGDQRKRGTPCLGTCQMLHVDAGYMKDWETRSTPVAMTEAIQLRDDVIYFEGGRLLDEISRHDSFLYRSIRFVHAIRCRKTRLSTQE